MEFLNSFHLPKDVKHRHKRRHSLKGSLRYVFTLPICLTLTLAVLLGKNLLFLDHLQQCTLQKQHPGCRQSQRATIQCLCRNLSPNVKRENLSGEATAWTPSPMYCSLGPACLLQVIATWTVVTDLNDKECILMIIFQYRARFYTCHGFVGQSQTYSKRGREDDTGETEKVNC